MKATNIKLRLPFWTNNDDQLFNVIYQNCNANAKTALLCFKDSLVLNSAKNSVIEHHWYDKLQIPFIDVFQGAPGFNSISIGIRRWWKKYGTLANSNQLATEIYDLLSNKNYHKSREVYYGAWGVKTQAPYIRNRQDFYELCIMASILSNFKDYSERELLIDFMECQLRQTPNKVFNQQYINANFEQIVAELSKQGTISNLIVLKQSLNTLLKQLKQNKTNLAYTKLPIYQTQDHFECQLGIKMLQLNKAEYINKIDQLNDEHLINHQVHAKLLKAKSLFDKLNLFKQKQLDLYDYYWQLTCANRKFNAKIVQDAIKNNHDALEFYNAVWQWTNEFDFALREAINALLKRSYTNIDLFSKLKTFKYKQNSLIIDQLINLGKY